MKVRISRIYYDTEARPDGSARLVVSLCGRDETGKGYKARLLDTQPYFYTTEDPQPHSLVTRIERNASKTIFGKPAHRIHVKFPFHVPRVREQYGSTEEADVLYEQRIRYDIVTKPVIEVPSQAEITPEHVRPSDGRIDHRVISLDIETHDKQGFATPRDPFAPVVSVSMWDSFTDSYVCILNGSLRGKEKDTLAAYFLERGWKVKVIETKDEAGLFLALKRFLLAVGPSYIVGWNVVLFDKEYLEERARRLECEAPEWRDHVFFDLMAAYVRRKEGEPEGRGLDFVAKEQGFGGKEKQASVSWMYEHDRAALLRYNAVDVWLAKEIMLKLDLLNFFLGLADYCGIGLDLLWMENNGYLEMAESRLLDSLLFHFLRGEKVLPTKRPGTAKPFKGGKVFDPVPGLFRNVVEIDNTGEYANIVRTFNLSPETLIYDHDYAGDCYKLPSGRRYLKDPRGILPQLVDGLIAERYAKKAAGRKEEERVVKEVTLSVFGTLGNAYFRLSTPEIAADITWVARDHTVWNRTMVEREGGFPLYGDTDSTFFQIGGQGEKLREWANEFVKRVNASYVDFLRPMGVVGEAAYLEVKLEHIYDAMLISPVKKRYVALYRDPKGDIEKDGVQFSMKVRGFELRRSNSALITRRLQREVFKRILTGAPRGDVAAYIRGVVWDAKAGKIPAQDFYVPIGLNKDHYKAVPEHVRAARWSNKNLGKSYKVGDKPRLVFGRIDGQPITDCFCLDWNDELPEGTVIDWGKTMDRTVLMPLANVFEVIGLSPRDVMEEPRDLGEII